MTNTPTPAAWAIMNPETGKIIDHFDTEIEAQAGRRVRCSDYEIEPLYTHPPAPPASGGVGVEALRKAFEMGWSSSVRLAIRSMPLDQNRDELDIYIAGLNLPAEPQKVNVTMLVDRDWLKQRVEADPDVDCEIGASCPEEEHWAAEELKRPLTVMLIARLKAYLSIYGGDLQQAIDALERGWAPDPIQPAPTVEAVALLEAAKAALQRLRDIQKGFGGISPYTIARLQEAITAYEAAR